MLFLLSFSPVHTNDVEYSTLLPILVLYLTPDGLIYALGKKWFLLSACYIYKPVLACGTFPLAFPIFMLKFCLIIKAYLKWHHLCPEKFHITPTPCNSAAL